jgi:hypothetical protein
VRLAALVLALALALSSCSSGDSERDDPRPTSSPLATITVPVSASVPPVSAFIVLAPTTTNELAAGEPAATPPCEP